MTGLFVNNYYANAVIHGTGHEKAKVLSIMQIYMRRWHGVEKVLHSDCMRGLEFNRRSGSRHLQSVGEGFN